MPIFELDLNKTYNTYNGNRSEIASFLPPKKHHLLTHPPINEAILIL